MNFKPYNYFRSTLIAIPIVILAVLVYKDINPSGYLYAEHDFCTLHHPMISKFSPHGRILDIDKNDVGCTQRMVIDPVYFDVRMPQTYDQARIKLWYKKDNSVPLRIGPAMDLDAWQWQLKDIQYYKTKGEWQFGLARYDISGVDYDGNDLRFLISSPGLDENQSQIVFNKIQIELIKQPLTASNWQDRIKEWILFK